jgi:hypothetical protein
MNAEFEAAVWNDVAVSTFSRNVLVARGIYMLTILHGERGPRGGAPLSRIDVEREQPIRLIESAVRVARRNAQPKSLS